MTDSSSKVRYEFTEDNVIAACGSIKDFKSMRFEFTLDTDPSAPGYIELENYISYTCHIGDNTVQCPN